jgi:hypothetical protein
MNIPALGNLTQILFPEDNSSIPSPAGRGPGGNTAGAFGNAEVTGVGSASPFDPFQVIGQLFGAKSGSGLQGLISNQFDLGSILGSVFDLAQSLMNGGPSLPMGQTNTEARTNASSTSETVVSVQGEAFSAARADCSAQGGVAGAGYGLAAQEWTGAGGHTESNGGLGDNGKYKLDFALESAVGVGAFDFSFFDTKGLEKIFSGVTGLFGEAFDSIFGEVAGLFGGGSGNGKAANHSIDDMLKPLLAMLGPSDSQAAS